MTEDKEPSPEAGWQPNLPPWSNVVLQPDDPEVQWIERLERRALPIPPAAVAIRELITRFEICHFKAERHIQKIVEAIGRMTLDFVPATIGKHHPKAGAGAWQEDKTGRSRQGQEFIWALQTWLTETPNPAAPAGDAPPALFEEVSGALGARDPRKSLLVSSLLNRLFLRADRPPLPKELDSFWEPIERTDICHYAFPSNLRQMISCIGRLEPPADYAGCGSCDDAQRRLAQERVSALCAWLRGQPSPLTGQLGERIPLKQWLAACLAKTLKEHAGLREPMPSDNSGL